MRGTQFRNLFATLTSSATYRRAEHRRGALAHRPGHVLDLDTLLKCAASALRRRTSWIPTFLATLYALRTLLPRLFTTPPDIEASAFLRTYRCLFFFAACTRPMHCVVLAIRLVPRRSGLTLQNTVMKRHGLLEDVKMYQRWWSAIRSYIATCISYFT